MVEWLLKFAPETYSDGRLVFLSHWPVELVLLALVIFGALAWGLYRQVRGKVGRRTNRFLLAVRLAVLLAVFFILARPALRSFDTPEDRIFTAVLVDTSRSMSIEDVPTTSGQRQRLDAARDMLAGGLLDRLGEESRVLLYGFGPGASRAGGLERLAPEGVTTNVFRSVRDADLELRGLPLAAVVMITDGCRNAGGSLADAAALVRNRGAAFAAVGVGNPSPPKDYEVARVFAPKKAWRNTAVDVYATLRHTDFREPFELHLLRGEEKVLSRTIEPAEAADLQRIRLTFTPDHSSGTATYRVAVPPAEGEKVVDNNFKEFALEIQDDRLPVLYLEGSPRMEYRFLRRAMFRDRDFRVVGVLRLASDRFYIQGANASEAYLAQGFPRTPDQLFRFKAVILGDIEAGTFSGEQLDLLERFVRERGGGMLMLGGVNSFGLGGYAGTPVGKMLPVSISPADGPYRDNRFACRPTPESAGHTLMRLADNEVETQMLWERMPPLIGLTPVGPPKKGATVLLRQTPEDGGRTVLAVHNYGQGRVGAFSSGGSWYWQVSRPADDEFHERFWKQVIRWLVVGAKERLTVETDADVYARGDSVILRASARSKDLRPVNDARVVATVTDPVGNTEDVPMYWTLSEAGVYQCRYRPMEEGRYRATVRVDGWQIEPAEAAFEVAEPLVEYSDAGRKDAALTDMAAAAGGKYYPIEDTSELADDLAEAISSARKKTDLPVDRDLWDMPALLLLCLLLLSVEWVVRRKSGLA